MLQQGAFNEYHNINIFGEIFKKYEYFLAVLLLLSTHNKFSWIIINPFKPSGLFYLNSLDRSISCMGGCLVSDYYYHVINPFKPSGLFYLNSLDRSISCMGGCLVSDYYYHVL